jgi:tetratricopeptide (TPR) repeat protein
MAGSGRTGSSKRKRPKASAASTVAVTDSLDLASIPAQDNGLDDLVLRYHAMAEELNGRGSMELAVPFYRQAIALLLTEREALRRQSGGSAGLDRIAGANQSVSAISAAVHGVLEAAASAGLPAMELERQLAALQDSLTPHNVVEAAAALGDLEQRWGQPHAGLSGLRARLALLEGDLAQALSHYERALELEPSDVRLLLNTGAARLAMGDAAGAADLLRPLAAGADGLADADQRRALWKNLARVEYELGEPMAAVQALLQLLALAPEALELESWLEVSRGWIAAGEAEAALQLLEALCPLVDAPAMLLPLLAEALEALGRYREAALVYRDLLRPALQQPTSR